MKSILITYDSGSYNPITRTYDPIDPLILTDNRVKDSIIFDTNRRTIYAQGLEYGNSKTFPYTYQGTGLIGNDISRNAAYYITGITQDIDGSITYTYSYSYITFATNTGIQANKQNNSYISGIFIDENGSISYTYGNITHTTSATELTSGLDGYGVLVDVNLDNNGNLTYSWYDSTVESGTGDNTTFELSGGEHTVIDGITQDSFGKISYHYTTIGASHGGEISGDFITYTYLTSGGTLNGTAGTFDNERTGTETSGVISNVNIDHTGKLSYSYISLENLLNVNQSSANEGTYTLQNNTSYQFITNVYQGPDGSISYTYAQFNTTHTSTHHTRTAAQSHVVTNVSIDADGNFSYDTKALNSVGKEDNEIILSNNGTAKVITNVYENPDGCLSYSYATINTSLSSSSDNITGVIYEVNVDTDGQTISYAHKNLETNSGTNDGTKKLNNNSSYKFITSISQDAYGKISYTYMTLQNSFSNSGTNNGIITNVNIDGTGKLSYTSSDLSGNTGTYVNALTYSKGTHIPYAAGTYIPFISGISQSTDGKVSYTYSAIYTDAENNYRYHELNIPVRTAITESPTTDDVEVISKISTINGNATSHDISYETIKVATKNYVDNLMVANDALRFRGVISPASAANGAVTFSNSDYSCGAVYKVNGSGYFGNQYVTSGDMVISYDDNATATDFSKWNAINNNIDLRTNDNVVLKNSEASSRVMTNVYLNDAGLLSYTSYSLGTQVVSTDDGGSNELLGNTYDVITGVTIEQDGLDTKLSYTYTTLTVNANHHSTNNNQVGGASKVVGFVNLSANGTLSYSYVDIAQPAYHYPVATAIDGSGNVIKSIEHDAKGHLTKVSYMDIATTDELVLFRLDNGVKIYLGGTKVANADGNTLYTDYSNQAYMESGVLTAQNGLISGGTLYVDKDTELNGGLKVNKRTSITEDLTVAGTSYLNGNIYIGNDPTDLAYIKSKNINFNNDNPIDFTHLKALWGVVGA